MHNSNDVIKCCNIISGILLIISSIFGFIEIGETFSFSIMTISTYSVFISIIILSVSLNFGLFNFPELEQVSNQMKYLLLFSFLIINTSIAGTVIGSMLSIYSGITLIMVKTNYIKDDMNEETTHNNSGDML